MSVPAARIVGTSGTPTTGFGTPGSQALPHASLPASPRPASSPVLGQIGETYDFLNRTLIPGNYTNISNVVFSQVATASQSEGHVFVGGTGSFIGVVNTTTGTVSGTIPAFAGATAIAEGRTSSELFVADAHDSLVSVVNPLTLTVVGTVNVGSSPTALAFDDVNGELYVALGSIHSVAVVRASDDSVVRSIPTGTNPDAVAFDRTSGHIFVANFGSANLTVIDASNNDTVLASVRVGTNPVAAVYFPPAGEVYVANRGSNNLSVVNGGTDAVIGSVALTFGPDAIAGDPLVGYLYVDNQSANAVVVVNFRTNTAVGSIPVAYGPSGIAWDSRTGDIYVVELASDNLTVISPGNDAVIASIQLGLQPVAVAYDSKHGTLGVTMSDANSLVVFNATTGAPVGTFGVGIQPAGVTYDPVNECFYVANSLSNSVTVVNSTTRHVVATIAVGNHPIAIAVVAAFDYLYVENSYALAGVYSLTVINGGSNQVVGSIPLSANSNLGGIAYDPVNGYLYVGTGSNVTVVRALTQAIVTTIPISGAATAITVDPVNNTIYVGCLFLYPLGQLDTNLAVINGTSDSLALTVTVGGGVQALDYNAKNGAVYVAELNAFGNLSVVNATQNVELGPVGDYLFASGLADAGAQGQVFAANPTAGSLAIVTLPGVGHYAVNFTETGLPTGRSWSVAIAGKTYSTTGTSILALESDGMYPFSIPPVLGFTANPASSTVTVDGSIVSVSVAFTQSPPTYAVNLIEAGLPSGTNWSVTLAGVIVNSTFSAITFHVPNGTADYTVGRVAGFAASPLAGTFHVAGADLSVNVTFTPTSTGTSTQGGTAPFTLRGLVGFGVAGAAAAVGGALGAALGSRARARHHPDAGGASEGPNPDVPAE